MGRKLSWKYPFYNGGFRLWECAQSFKHADLSLFLNRFDLGYAIRKLQVAPERTACVRNGIADEFITHADALKTVPPPLERPVNVAFIGSDIKRKGTDILHNAMIPLMRHDRNANLSFFGVGKAADTILDTYPEDVRARVTLTPRYRNDQLPDMLAHCHVVAAPSRSEGFPLAIMEAMACGLVPVISDIPGPTEFVEDNRNGLVVPAGDATALKAGLERLSANPGLWRRLRAEAISTALAHSWSAVAAETVALYERFATGKGVMAN